ncbi:phytoene desaturase family protein [Streptomyces sp. NBC_01800]|uniref:phytoene desaturase family protein n=1 Tax=Streptomyces sp. NBC_01800 TaxID=2975945 RepID=UPI002DDA501C|nr:NAD(P)/FAD-dependent oxidoreductase [Streptomyces sp. NBC_01800]
MTSIDAAVVGTGPNGLAAAVTLARAGLRVELYERADDIGGGLRSKALFDEDVMHDMCAAVHPMAAASPFFREFDLGARGVELLNPDINYAHPLDGGRAALVHRDLSATCEQLGPDGERWRSLMQPLLDHSAGVVDFVLAGRRTLPRDPLAPLLLARRVLRHSTSLGGFRGEKAAALLTGVAALAMRRLPSIASGAVAMLLGHLAHGSGRPLPRGGSARIEEVMAVDITAHGGLFHTGAPVTDLRQLRHARTVFLDD